jgi:spermidine synthase
VSRPRSLALLAAVFALSGCAGLIHEVAWARTLGQSLGNSLQALTVVLVAFLGGLGAGSAIGARAAGRWGDPLIGYAGLEGLLALYGISSPAVATAVPRLLEAIGPACASPLSLAALRLGLALAALAVPTLLMGATFPFLVREAVGGGAVPGRAVAVLYGVNTLGGALGALLGSFGLLPFLGTRGSFFVAGLLNAAAAASALLLRAGRRSARALSAKPSIVAPAPSAAVALPGPRGLPPAALASAVALSGAVGAVLQIGWTRAATLAFGSSVYALGVTLAAYILGLGAGPLVVGRRLSRPGAAPLVAAVALAGAGVSSLLLVPVLGRLPIAAALVSGRMAHTPSVLIAAQFSVMAGLLLLPTLCQGMAFPALAACAAGPPGEAHGSAGRLYAASTWGAVAGFIVAGYVALPLAGTRRSLVAASAVSMLLALIPILFLSRRRRSAWIAASGLVLGAFLLPRALPGWDPDLISGGGFLYGPIYSAAAGAGGDLREAIRRRGAILYSREDGVSLVTVRRSPAGVLSLQINGRTEASTGGDMSTQLLSAHLPLLLHSAPADILIVGLASGITLGAAERHAVQRIQVIEIAPAVREAARRFDAWNGRALDDRRVDLVIDDARSRLLVRPRRFDVISSQPSNPWVAGVSNLFTVEFYRLARARLKPGGLFCQWVQAYRLSPEDFRGLVRSFLEVFPRATLWEESAGGGDYFLLGAEGDAPLRIDPSHLRSPRLQAAWDDLLRAGIGQPADLLSRFVTGHAGLEALAAGARLHTDDTLYLETRAPLALFRDSLREQLTALRRVRRSVMDILPGGIAASDPALVEALRARARDREVRLDIATNLKDADLWSLGDPYLAAGLAALRAGLVADAIAALSVAGGRNPESGTAHYLLGEAYRAAGLEDAAGVAYREAVRRDPSLSPAWNAFGRHLAARGDAGRAAAAFEKALEIDPRLAVARNNLGTLRLQSGDPAEAERLFTEALRDDPALAAGHANLGLLLKRRGDPAAAERRYREAIDCDPLNLDVRYNLAALLREQGRKEEARRELLRLLEIDPYDPGARRALAAP